MSSVLVLGGRSGGKIVRYMGPVFDQQVASPDREPLFDITSPFESAVLRERFRVVQVDVCDRERLRETESFVAAIPFGEKAYLSFCEMASNAARYKRLRAHPSKSVQRILDDIEKEV